MSTGFRRLSPVGIGVRAGGAAAWILGLCQCVAPPLSPPPGSASVASPVGAGNASGRWMQVQATTAAMPAGARWETRDVQGPEGRVRLTCVVFDARQATLRVHPQPDRFAGADAPAEWVRQEGALAAINGGYFHPDFTPLGIVIADGQPSGTFLNTSLVSGLVGVRGSAPVLEWNREVLARGTANLRQALQAGPRLVDAHRPVTGLERTRVAARSFIATDGGHRWWVGTAQRVTLAGLGELLATPGLLGEFRIERALNLDGGRSTALHARLANGEERRVRGWSTVANGLLVVPHAPNQR